MIQFGDNFRAMELLDDLTINTFLMFPIFYSISTNKILKHKWVILEKMFWRSKVHNLSLRLVYIVHNKTSLEFPNRPRQEGTFSVMNCPEREV